VVTSISETTIGNTWQDRAFPIVDILRQIDQKDKPRSLGNWQRSPRLISLGAIAQVMLSDATCNGGLTLSTRFMLPDPVRRQWRRVK
jgi:hypothetical protein